MIQLNNSINHKPRTKCGHVQLIKLYLRQIEDRVKDTDDSRYICFHCQFLPCDVILTFYLNFLFKILNIIFLTS